MSLAAAPVNSVMPLSCTGNALALLGARKPTLMVTTAAGGGRDSAGAGGAGAGAAGVVEIAGADETMEDADAMDEDGVADASAALEALG